LRTSLPSILMEFHRLAVWLDHREARVFHVRADGFSKETIEAPHRHIHRHPKGEETDKNRDKQRPDDAHRFFRELALTLADANEILIVGPSTAKLHFLNHVHHHDHGLLPKIVGMETVDHPTDGQLVAYAKKYFKNGGRSTDGA
jgi:stalled ribosome rescue protein Dom34